MADDHGFIIIEVLVSAIILVTVSLAVFLTLDRADQSAGQQQRRTLAANFAQSELERLRSLPVEDIQSQPASRIVSRDGIKYTITTVAKWISDGSDEPQCTTRTGGLDYLRLTVKIAWQNAGNSKPISFTSLYTPSAGAGGGNTGSASVFISDRNGNGVPGVPVTMDGAADFSGTTNANGCVVFGFIPTGDYTLTFSRTGFVDSDSNPNPTDKVTVVGGQTAKQQYDFDSGGYTNATFMTRTALGSSQPTFPERVQLLNAGQPSGPLTIDLAGKIDLTTGKWIGAGTPLFPFTSPYAIYAGNCAANAVPSTSPDARFVNISPGATQGTGTVWVPALNVTVKDGSGIISQGNPVPNARVQYDPGSGCAPIYKDRPTQSNGQLLDPGFPYSTSASVCAMSATRHQIFTGVSNTNTVSGTPLTFYLTSTTGGTTASKAGGYQNGLTSCFV